MICLHVTINEGGKGGSFTCKHELGYDFPIGEVANEPRQIKLTFSTVEDPQHISECRVFADRGGAGYLAIVLKSWCGWDGGDQ